MTRHVAAPLAHHQPPRHEGTPDTPLLHGKLDPDRLPLRKGPHQCRRMPRDQLTPQGERRQEDLGVDKQSDVAMMPTSSGLS